MDKSTLLDTEQKNVPHMMIATINKLSVLSLNNTFPFDEESEQCILEFLNKIQPENLRRITMTLACKIRDTIKSGKPVICGNLNDIVQQILCQLLVCMSNNDEQFKVEFINGKVPNKLYEDASKMFAQQDITKFPTLLNDLLSIKFPESYIRCKTICIRVKELLKNPETAANAKNWIEIFKLDINKYSQPNSIAVDSINDIWQESVKYTVNQIESMFPKHSMEKFSQVIAAFFRRCENKPLRIATMELMCKVYETLKDKRLKLFKEEEKKRVWTLSKIITSMRERISNYYYYYYYNNNKSKTKNINEDIKKKLADLTYVREIILQIILEFEMYLAEKDEAFFQDSFYRNVPEQLWINTFEIIKRFDITKCPAGLDELFGLKKFDSQQRDLYVGKYIRKLIAQKDTFKNGVQWTFTFNLTYVKSFDFDYIVYNMHLYEMETELLPLISQHDKLRYLMYLKIACRQADRGWYSNELIENFVKKMTTSKLLKILEAEDYENMKKEFEKKKTEPRLNDARNDYISKKMKDQERQNKNFHHKLEHGLHLLNDEKTLKN